VSLFSRSDGFLLEEHPGIGRLEGQGIPGEGLRRVR
jgi:hypothetical protein